MPASHPVTHLGTVIEAQHIESPTALATHPLATATTALGTGWWSDHQDMTSAPPPT